jgi:hypothetical protein
VLTGEVPHSSSSHRSLRLAAPRRRLAALAAAGVAGAVVVTGAVTGASAAAPAPAPSHVVTLTSSSSSSAGHLVLRFRYEIGRTGKIRPISISYAGGTRIKVRHPALIVSLRPLGLLQPRQVHARKGVPVVSLILRLRNTHHFSGNLPLRAFIPAFRNNGRTRIPFPGGRILEATMASVQRFKRQVTISVPAVLQVGILFGPALP